MLEFLLVFILIASLSLIFWKSKKSREKLPPGPIRWPILGSIPQMLMEDPVYPHLQLSGLAKKYGGIVSFGFGVHYAVVVSDYEIYTKLFKRPETILERFRFDIFEQRNNYKNLGLIWSYGDVWKEQRSYTVKLLKQFGFGKKHAMDETLQEEMDDLVVDIRKEIESSGGIWEVDPGRLAASQINILWTSVGGYRFDPKSSKTKRHLELNFRVIESLGPKNMLAAFPFLKVFPKLSGFTEHCEIHRDIREFILELVEDARERRQGRVNPESFVEAYLDEIDRNKSNPNSNMTQEQLLLTLMDLFLAGSDTPAALTNWIILYLALHPNVQAKVRAEVNRSLPITALSLVSMPFTHAVILEAMRHSPFLVGSVPRRVTEDIECAGYRLPAGTCLFSNAYPMCHDKTFWGDPEVFRPERLISPNGTLDSSKAERIVTFGTGGRICPGENVAMISVFMVMTSLVKNFSLGLIPGREAKFEAGTPGVTLKPKQFALQVEMIS